jgi:hypothetical protein
VQAARNAHLPPLKRLPAIQQQRRLAGSAFGYQFCDIYFHDLDRLRFWDWSRYWGFD